MKGGSRWNSRIFMKTPKLHCRSWSNSAGGSQCKSTTKPRRLISSILPQISQSPNGPIPSNNSCLSSVPLIGLQFQIYREVTQGWEKIFFLSNRSSLAGKKAQWGSPWQRLTESEALRTPVHKLTYECRLLWTDWWSCIVLFFDMLHVLLWAFHRIRWEGS